MRLNISTICRFPGNSFKYNTTKHDQKRDHILNLELSRLHQKTTIGNQIMTKIHQEDLIQSIADGLQYISYYHPADYIEALTKAWKQEESPAAKDAMTQILVNSRMCAEGNAPSVRTQAWL